MIASHFKGVCNVSDPFSQSFSLPLSLSLTTTHPPTCIHTYRHTPEQMSLPHETSGFSDSFGFFGTRVSKPKILLWITYAKQFNRFLSWWKFITEWPNLRNHGCRCITIYCLSNNSLNKPQSTSVCFVRTFFLCFLPWRRLLKITFFFLLTSLLWHWQVNESNNKSKKK